MTPGHSEAFSQRIISSSRSTKTDHYYEKDNDEWLTIIHWKYCTSSSSASGKAFAVRVFLSRLMQARSEQVLRLAEDILRT